MNDEMSQYSGVAASYKDFPLSALRQMQSILEWEISKRLEGFGVYSDEVSVGDVEEDNVAKRVENNVYIGKFGRGNE